MKKLITILTVMLVSASAYAADGVSLTDSSIDANLEETFPSLYIADQRSENKQRDVSAPTVGDAEEMVDLFTEGSY